MHLRHLLLILSLLFASSLFANATMLDVMGDKKIAFSTLKGKWVLINYWASWCHPCVEEIQELNRFYDENKDRNVALFAVNYDALPPSMQEKLIKQFGIHYPSLSKDPALALSLGDIEGVPVTFVFSPEGQLSKTLFGGQTLASLRTLITKRS